jgi:hypothetical protein
VPIFEVWCKPQPGRTSASHVTQFAGTEGHFGTTGIGSGSCSVVNSSNGPRAPTPRLSLLPAPTPWQSHVGMSTSG